MIRFIPLFLALLFTCPDRVTAQHVDVTREDTAFARALLSDALQAFSRINVPASPHIETRLVSQLTVWGMYDQAWSFGLARDSARTGAERGSWLIARGLAAQFQSGDSAGVLSRVGVLPVDLYAGVIQAFAILERCSHPRLVDQLIAGIVDPFQRARAIANGRFPCVPDRVDGARAALRAAIQIAGDTLTGPRAYEWIGWHYQLRRLGGDVSVQDLVEITRREITRSELGDLPAAQLQVANALVDQLDYEAAAPLLDSVQAHYSRLAPRPYTTLATIHQLRRTGPDSAIALALRDTAMKTQARPLSSMPGLRIWDAQRKLRQALDSLNRSATRIALDTAVASADPVGMIVLAVQQIEYNITYPHRGPDSTAARNTAIEFAGFLHDELWRVSANLRGDERDSARVAIVALLASFDEQRALTLARQQLRVPRMRDRVIADVARRIAKTDSDAAARLAAPLQDPIARNLAYLPLAESAVTGGRLQLAKHFADRTASGEARVRAQFAVANALFAVDSIPQARARAAAILEHLDPVWSCEGCAIVMGPNTVLPPPLPGMNRRFIGDVVFLVLRTGGVSELRAWVEKQDNAVAQASAALAVVEGWAQLRLGRIPDYPIH